MTKVKYQKHPTDPDVVIMHVESRGKSKTYERKNKAFRQDVEAAGLLED